MADAATALDTLESRIKPSLMAQLILLTIGVFVALFLIWAAVAQVDEVSRGTGKVIPSRQLQVIQNLEGGIVKEVLVERGQQVKRGQVLMRLDQTQLAADFLNGQEGYNALVAKIARLQGEVAGHAPQFAAALQRSAPAMVQSELALYSARQAELLANLNVGQARLAQAERAVSEAEVQTQTTRQALALAEQEVKLLTPLVQKGIEPQVELLRAQGRVAQASGEYSAAQLGTERARAAVREAQYDIASVRERFRAKVVEELTEAKAELAGMGRELPALEDKVTRTDVRAPIAGTVNRVLVTTIGGVVRPGEPLVEIVPSDDTLVVEARVSPKDIGQIATGQSATVKITAYDSSLYGGLKGSIESISPDSITDEKTGELYYLIHVRTEGDTLKSKDGAPLEITPGMVAEVDVLGRKRSIMDYILTPITRITDKAMREN
ncbi:HlyD family type I secretion periplasmic adaptor subunit [Hankyongella ginsenosidimutans]|nr:HlyD family type I secretion periplasmic adaptor subunit [Hankyongella ginsenosidimutans]